MNAAAHATGPDLADRTVVVTGATSGIGRSTTAALVGAAARVIMAVRDVDKGKAVADEITGPAPRALVDVQPLDLADLSSVRAFADRWTGRLDIMINNAGVMSTRRSETADGFELQLGTNHLGHFALTNLLLPHLTDRVVSVSSSAHRMGHIELN
ncbi:MAG TPA: SDR family NAD(P)-dependent oxidoreductase, partial [Microlunatus sp.]|nr:SDR family NAD(P)-dependent oxidoreductase [Microlunatus sp.]